MRVVKLLHAFTESLQAKRNAVLSLEPHSAKEFWTMQFLLCGPDEEDNEMFKLATKRLKEVKDELVDGVPWAYYPSDILLLCGYSYVAIVQ